MASNKRPVLSRKKPKKVDGRTGAALTEKGASRALRQRAKKKKK